MVHWEGEKKMMEMVERILNNPEATVAFFALGVAIYQFFITRRLAKREKRLLLRSKFFYLQTMLTTAISRLIVLSNGQKDIPEQTLKELALACRMDNSVFDVISELADLSYVYFDSMDEKAAQNVQNFLGYASETYHIVNGYYDVLEKSGINSICLWHDDIDEMDKKMKEYFKLFKGDLQIHCAISVSVMQRLKNLVKSCKKRKIERSEKNESENI